MVFFLRVHSNLATTTYTDENAQRLDEILTWNKFILKNYTANDIR